MNLTRLPSAQGLSFRRHLRPEVVHGDAAYLFSEHGVTAVAGRHVETLAPLLDGTRDLPALLDAVRPALSPDDAAAVLVALADADLLGYRGPTDSDTDAAALAYWDGAGLDATAAAAGARTSPIQLRTLGSIAPEPALAALAAADLTVHAEDGPTPAALCVVLCDDYLDPGLADLDRGLRASGQPWLLAKPAGEQLWVGPVFRPDGGPCWSCLATRLWRHRSAEAYVQGALGRTGPAPRPVAAIPALTRLALDLVALEAAKWLGGLRPDGAAVHTVDTLSLRVRRHELHPRPQCASCGDPGLLWAQANRPVALVPRAKASRSGGGHRATPPEQVLDQYRHLISPVTGIVRSITRDPRGPEFLNAFRVGDNHAMGARRSAGLRASLRSQSAGKGTTSTQAETSALCESIERHCGVFEGGEARVRGSYRDLGEQAVHPDSCQLFHTRQLAGRARWNATHSAFHHVCEPFDERAALDWTPVWSLTGQRHRLLPTEMLYYGVAAGPGPRMVVADSNGAAAGTSLEDAVLQGLLELVERDSVALWWYNRTRQPAVDLASFGDPWIEELRTVYATHHRRVWALDLTSDLGVPAMVALSRRTDKPAQDIAFGFGAHLDPAVALTRALTEMNQLLPAVVDAAPGGGYDCEDRDAVRWWREATVTNQPHLRPDRQRPAVRSADYGYRPRTDLRADVTAVQSTVERLGHEVLVLDQTRPDIGLPVVKVIVPGLRHFWARFAPGRLFDVPVRLGRLAEPTRYDDLNPVPLFV